MTTQLFMFDDPLPAHCRPLHLARKSDPPSSHQAAEAAASGQIDSDKARILALLKLRPVSSRELAEITPKYTQRTSDLRADGYKIDAKRTVCAATGERLWMYFLAEPDA